MRSERLSAVRGRAVAAAILSCLAVLVACGCGGGHQRSSTAVRPSAPTTPANGPVEGERPAFGLTENEAALLWSPSRPGRTPPAFRAARDQLGALHPSYLRLLVDWAALQPTPTGPPALAATVGGCARDVAPCAAYAGIAEDLAAIGSQQRTAGSGGYRVVLDLFGVPAWAAREPSGCEVAGGGPFSRALRPGAIAAYRALIRSLLALGQREGVALEWWSPWNEPNDPRFLSPQRASCAPGAPPASPAVYAQLARAMASELAGATGTHHMVLGELNDLEIDSPHSTSVSTFIAALPGDVICMDGVWSIHAYARHAPAPPSSDAVHALEAALDARGRCGRSARVWVTEAGAGAPHPGRVRPPGAGGERAGCVALAEQLLAWHSDPRVDAVFQYTFREDPAFPVGVASADLTHLYPTYGLWLRWSELRNQGRAPPAPAAACA